MTQSIELSIVAPVFNGAETIEEFIMRTEKSLEILNMSYQFILIDDGSTDESLSMMRKILQNHPTVMIIKLTENFGQSNAIAAGFTKAEGNYIVVMDSDLQDKPEDILLLYNKIIKSSSDMIIATRRLINRSIWRNICSNVFYFLTILLTSLRFPCGSGVFRILKRKCLDQLDEALQTPGTVLSYIHAAGYSWETIVLPRELSRSKKSNYSFGDMLRLAFCRILPYNRLLRKLLGRRFLLRYIPEFRIDEIFMGQQNE